MTFDVHQLDLFLLVGAGVTILAILAVLLSTRIGLPSLLIYLLMGVLLGRERAGHPLRRRRARARARLRRAGADPGRGRTDDQLARRCGRRCASVVSLATIGIAVSIARDGRRRPPRARALLGARRPARRGDLTDRRRRGLLGAARAADLTASRGVLESESGLNDAPTVVLVTLVSTGAIGDHGLAVTAGIVVYELVGGVLLGLADRGRGCLGAAPGRAAVVGPLPARGGLARRCSPTASPRRSHASGFAAIYVAALVLGNSDLPHRTATRSFAEGVAWLAADRAVRDARSAADTERRHLVDRRHRARGRRPCSCCWPGRSRWWWPRSSSGCRAHELAFLSWAGLRGAVPIVLATIPLAEHVTDAERLFDIVFVVVVVSTLVTGPTLPAVAKRLRVTRRSEPRQLDLEVAPLDRMAADMLQVTVSPVSRLHGVEVGELRLPPRLVGLARDPRRRGDRPRTAYGPAPG